MRVKLLCASLFVCCFVVTTVNSYQGTENDSSSENESYDTLEEISNFPSLKQELGIDKEENRDVQNTFVSEVLETQAEGNDSSILDDENLSPDEIARRKLREFNPGLLEFIENALKIDHNKMAMTLEDDQLISGSDNLMSEATSEPHNEQNSWCNITDYYFQQKSVCRPDEVYFMNEIPDPPDPPEPHCKCASVNAFYYEIPTLKLISSDDFVELLERNISNLCILALFYAPWCPFSAKFSPIVNTLGRAFPTLTAVAVDATENKNLDSKYGVVGVPQLLMFYNGKLVIRFHSRHFNEIIKGIKNSTGLEPAPSVTIEKFGNMGPLPTDPTEEQDIYLWFSCLIVFSFASAVFVHSTAIGRRVWSVVGFVQPLPDFND